MTTTVRPYTDADRRTQLAWLAGCWDTTGEAVRELMLAWTVHESLTGDSLAAAWAEYMDARRTAGDLESGEMTWQEYEPDLTCPERQQAACEHADMQAAGALDVLIYGTAQARGTGNAR